MIRIRLKYLSILFGILTVILLSGYSVAADINCEFDSINIETNPSPNHLGSVSADQDYQIEGPYRITIKNIKNSIRIKLNFTAPDRQSYLMITDKIMLQYRCVSSTDQGSWSQWFFLKSLPLMINYQSAEKSFPERVAVYLQLKVPQSLDIQRGVYRGEFSLLVE